VNTGRFHDGIFVERMCRSLKFIGNGRLYCTKQLKKFKKYGKNNLLVAPVKISQLISVGETMKV